MSDRPRYNLTIQAMPEDCPAVVRLRRVVKALLRHYGFKLVRVVELSEGNGQTPQETRTDAQH